MRCVFGRTQMGKISFLQTQFSRKRSVRALIVLLKILEMLAARRDHVQETASRVYIFLVLAQVRPKLINPLGDKRNLYLRRAGVSFVAFCIFDYILFLSFGQHK